MIPFLTYPLALIGLVAVPAFVAIYFFRNIFRRRPVSSLLLWETLSKPKEGGSRVERLQFPLIFFLELLAILLLVAAAIDLRWPGKGSGKLLIVVLDDSGSMRARSGPGSIKDTGKRAVARQIRGGQFYGVRFIVAGVQPRLMGSSVSKKEDAVRMLDRWKCNASSAALDSAVAMALEIGGRNSRVLVVTDKKPEKPISSNRIKWIACGKPQGNMGFINAARTPGPHQDRCFLEVKNFSPTRGRTKLTIQEGERTRERVLSLDAWATSRVVLDVPGTAPGIVFRLSSDPLALDNEVHLLPQTVSRIRIEMAFNDKKFEKMVSRGVKATGLASPISANPQIVFTDARVAIDPTSSRWVVRFLRRPRGRAYVGPFVIDSSHPMGDGLGLNGTVWGAASTNRVPGYPVVMVGDVTLVADEEKLTGGHEVRIQLCPEISTLQDTPNWPVFLWNIMNWRKGYTPGLKQSNLRVGMHAELSAGPTVKEAEVVLPGGRTFPAALTRGKAAIPATEIGVFNVRAGTRTYAFAANFLSAEESNISVCDSGEWGKWVDAEALRKDFFSSAWIFVLLALGIMTTHLYVATHGET